MFLLMLQNVSYNNYSCNINNLCNIFRQEKSNFNLLESYGIKKVLKEGIYQINVQLDSDNSQSLQVIIIIIFVV